MFNNDVFLLNIFNFIHFTIFPFTFSGALFEQIGQIQKQENSKEKWKHIL